jgi:hypothetical protein
MSLTLSLEDLDPFVSDTLLIDHWVSSIHMEIEQVAKPPIGVSLSYFLTPDHAYQGLFSTIEEFISLSDEVSMRFRWIWIEGQTSLLENTLKSLESNGYEVKIWREAPSEIPNSKKAPERCGALLQRSCQHENNVSSPLLIVNHTKGHIDPIKLNRLFRSDPFTRAEHWHTRDLFKEEQERKVLLESQKSKRHDPLRIFDSDEAPIVVKMNLNLHGASKTPER